jgi:hypothetical protein
MRPCSTADAPTARNIARTTNTATSATDVPASSVNVSRAVSAVDPAVPTRTVTTIAPVPAVLAMSNEQSYISPITGVPSPSIRTLDPTTYASVVVKAWEVMLLFVAVTTGDVRGTPLTSTIRKPTPSTYAIRSPAASVTVSRSTDVDPSKCWIVTVFEVDACTFWMCNVLTFRVVDAAGAATSVVVVAVVTFVFVRPGVTVPDARSTQDACTSMSPVALVTIRTMSLVLVRRSIG